MSINIKLIYDNIQELRIQEQERQNYEKARELNQIASHLYDLYEKEIEEENGL